MKKFRFPLIVIFLAAVFHFVPFFDGAEAYTIRPVLVVSAGLRNAAFSVRNFFKNISDAGEIGKENIALKEQNQLLKEQLVAVAGLSLENEYLNELLGYTPRTDQVIVPAIIIGSDPDATMRALVINRGTEEGIKRGDPVIVGKGTYVGKVERVSAGRSTVLLPIDPRSAIGVMLTDHPEANGVAQGEKGLVVAMTLIPQHAPVEKGDIVVTTGRDQRIPRGLILGNIENVTVVPSDPFMSATIVPAVDPMTLTKVAVIRQK